MDNILLMQEIVRGHHRDQGLPRCAIKLDLMKAYDSVDWVFLFEVRRCMERPVIFIDWVKACATTPSISILIHGELKGYFAGKRGLRQGDPISFLLLWRLFLLCWILGSLKEGLFPPQMLCYWSFSSNVCR